MKPEAARKLQAEWAETVQRGRSAYLLTRVPFFFLTLLVAGAGCIYALEGSFTLILSRPLVSPRPPHLASPRQLPRPHLAVPHPQVCRHPPSVAPHRMTPYTIEVTEQGLPEDREPILNALPRLQRSLRPTP